MNRGHSARGGPLASDALRVHVVVLPIESVETRSGKYREAGEVPCLSQALSMRDCLAAAGVNFVYQNKAPVSTSQPGMFVAIMSRV